MTKEIKSRRKTWDYPWGYKESFMVAAELLLLGLIFEVLSGGRGSPLLVWPVNLVTGLLMLSIIIIVFTVFRKKSFVKWLSGIPAAISAISFFTLVVLLLGFIPQDETQVHRFINILGLSHIKNSWLMMISGLYFLLCLGFVAIRRSRPLTRKNIGFLLNHAGLWITIAAGYLGSGDLQRMNLTIIEEQGTNNIAVNQRTSEPFNLPFAVSLKDFRIDDYNPKIGIMDSRTGTIIGEEGKSLLLIEPGLEAELTGWDISVMDYLPDAMKLRENYFSAEDSTGSAPAAYIKAVSRESGREIKGWVSCGSYAVMHQYIPLDQHNFLVMTFPEPQKFASDIVLIDQKGNKKAITLEVNKPYKYKGWKLYQLSYDQKMGKWSKVSILEAVRDPWLPLVYLGVFMLLAGAAYLFWIGREIKDL